MDAQISPSFVTICVPERLAAAFQLLAERLESNAVRYGEFSGKIHDGQVVSVHWSVSDQMPRHKAPVST